MRQVARDRMPRVAWQVTLGALAALWPVAAAAQLDDRCTVSILNRTAQVRADGSWQVDNVPANFGPVRARATCVQDGLTRSGQSDYFLIQANVVTGFNPHISLGAVTPIPEALTLTAPLTELTPGQLTSQVTVTARYPDGTTADVTHVPGTSFTVSNASVLGLGAGGVITGLGSGTAVVSANKDGALGLLRVTVRLTDDTDGDGLADDLERANGLDPSDPRDALADADGDGLTNGAELLQFGTDMRNRDTDGDGVVDGEEATAGADGFVTNPLLADSDGDGLRDGLEVATGSDPTDASSYNLAAALSSLAVTPPSFVLTVNTVLGEASLQLAVTGQLLDGTSINLTSRARGTNYASSNLGVCNFGAPDGRVFAGANGSCVVTVTNAGFSAQATALVRSFAPVALAFLDMPGFANNVDVAGNFAYVASGAAGLQVVNVSDRAAPQIVGSRDTPGNANDVRVEGARAYVADGAAGLQILDVSDPAHPQILGALDTPGNAQDVVVRGTLAYVADGATGLLVVDVSDPAVPRLLGTADTAGQATGVDVVTDRGLAVVADGTAGIRLVDVSDPGQPVLRGGVATGDARDVVARGNEAFVADFNGGFTTVDITDPSAPVLLARVPLNLGGRLVDIALAGELGFGADVLFVNGVPIVHVGNAAAPVARAILDFRNFRDDNGTGIAVDGTFVYLTASLSLIDNGTSGPSRLYIGQYLAQEDLQGQPPAVHITAPAAGTTIVQGTSLTVTVDATDDVAVAAVDFLVDGQVAFTDTSAPYQFTLSPSAPGTLVLGARAVDLGGNVGTAQAVAVEVVPDPLTTAIGRVVDAAGVAVAGATVTANLGGTATTSADGSFSIPGLATVRGSISVSVVVFIGGQRHSGRSGAMAPVPGGQTDLGTVVVRRGARVGYYDLSLNRGSASQVGPILTAGLEAFDVGDLATADLSQFDVLFVQNPNNNGYAFTFLNNLAKVHQFISNGGVFIFHDRHVSTAGSVLPGTPGTIVRDFSDDRNIQIVDGSTSVTNGPGGVVTDTTLDGGNSSSHGWALASTVPAAGRGILSTGDPTHLVLYSYPFGLGQVVYSTIPLDFYLAGSGAPSVNAAMRSYAANVLAYASDLR